MLFIYQESLISNYKSSKILFQARENEMENTPVVVMVVIVRVSMAGK